MKIEDQSWESRDWEFDRGTMMTNFDHSIRDGAEDELRANPGLLGEYCAANFHAYVRFDPDLKLFVARLSRYGNCEGYIGAESLKELMEECSAEWGAE